MNQQKMTAPVRQHRDGHKTAGKSSKSRTIILLAAAKFFNWLIGEIGLSLLAVFGLPPLLGLAPWLPLPLIGGALLTASAALVEEVLA